MKIKRYFAADIRTAIRMVREQQGPDAVILSNRKVEGGVEIVAAVDYDESAVLQSAGAVAQGPGAAAEADVLQQSAEPRDSRQTQIDQSSPSTSDNVWSQEPVLAEMRRELINLRGMMETQLSGLAWGELARSQPQRADLLRRLVALGFDLPVSRRVADRVGGSGEPDLLWRQALGLLAHAVPVAEDDILASGGIVALVGPTGVGKTTMVAKLAARFCLRHGRRQVALVTTDNYRIGAHEQLRAFGRILDVPVRVVEDEEPLGEVLASLADRRLVLIDTAGMSQRDKRLPQHLALLQDDLLPIRRYLVLTATTHVEGLREVVRAFARTPLAGCMLTKLDETATLGGVLSVVIEQSVPVAYVADGQRVPEDLAPARAHNLISLAVSLARHAGAPPSEEAVALSYGRVAANGQL